MGESSEFRVPRDRANRERLYREAGLSAAERAAVESMLPLCPADLLTPEEHEALNADLAEIARCRRRAEAESRNVGMA